MTPRLGFERQHEGAVAIDVDGLDRIHLDRDGKAHGMIGLRDAAVGRGRRGTISSAALPVYRGKTDGCPSVRAPSVQLVRSEEHTSELQSLMRIAYAVFCLKKK